MIHSLKTPVDRDRNGSEAAQRSVVLLQVEEEPHLWMMMPQDDRFPVLPVRVPLPFSFWLEAEHDNDCLEDDVDVHRNVRMLP